MYSDEEILEHLTEGEGRGFLGRSMYDAIMEKIKQQENELQQKDKEIERLKEEVENYKKVILNSTRIIDKFKETYIICFDDPLWRFVKRLEKCLKGSE